MVVITDLARLKLGRRGFSQVTLGRFYHGPPAASKRNGQNTEFRAQFLIGAMV
jgi:hypothetical protein